MLTSCPECHHAVSDSAAACPSCGHPLTPKAGIAPATSPQTKPPPWLFGTGAVVLVLLLGIAAGSATRPASNVAQAASAADDSAAAAQADANAAMASANAVANAAEEVPPAPLHSWISHQNGEYGYTVGISDEARKNGRAAEEVVMFRYLGFKNGVYTLVSDEDGSVATCSLPCTVVTATNGYSVQHVAFNPGSVIGAAFEDAINGQLEPWQPPSPPPTYAPTGMPVSQPPPQPPTSDNGIDPNAAG